MANHISHAALPYPVKGCRYTLLVPYLDADGDPTDPTTPDTERSIDAAAFADCTEEVTTITGSNGVGYITLTGDETNGSAIALAAKVASGPKATLATLYPRTLAVIWSGTATAGAAGSITLSATAPPLADDLIAGCIVRTTGGTGGGGGSGSAGNQARVITDYVASTRVASVSPNWETNPDNTTTYEVLLTDAALIRYSDLQTIRGAQVNALVSGRVDASVGAIAANAITATAINADAITAAKVADATIDAATFAAGAINATAIAADAITDAKVSTDMDAYHAKVWVVKESTTTDHYAVGFFKNGQPVTSGITSPTIQVIKASDGTDLIASGALTQIGSLGIYKKDESTNKMTAGQIYFAKVEATIDSATRTWYQQVGRDST